MLSKNFVFGSTLLRYCFSRILFIITFSLLRMKGFLPLQIDQKPDKFALHSETLCWYSKKNSAPNAATADVGSETASCEELSEALDLGPFVG